MLLVVEMFHQCWNLPLHAGLGRYILLVECCEGNVYLVSVMLSSVPPLLIRDCGCEGVRSTSVGL